jgi:hypothetical protein
MMCDPSLLGTLKQQEMLDEAKRERLAALVEHHRSPLRRELAVFCVRLADWLDDPKRYVQPSESGRAGWARLG